MKPFGKIGLGLGFVFIWSCRTIPLPVLSFLSPDREISTLASFTLSVRGSNFQDDSKIFFNGQPKATTFLSSIELTCNVSASDMALTPGASQIVPTPVYVNTPQAGNSNILNFSVHLYPEFLAAKKIADSTSSYSDYIRPLIEIDNAKKLFVVWRDQRKLFFAVSSDTGASWSAPAQINESPVGFYRFSLAVDKASGAVFVAWEEGSVIYLIRSTDFGQSWTPRAALSDPVAVTAENPGVFVDPSGGVYLAYPGRFPPGSDHYYAVTILKSTDQGRNFNPLGSIGWNTYFTGDNAPQFGLDKAGVFYLLFPSDFGTRYSTNYLSYSSNGGQTWSAPSNINLNAPAMAIDELNGLNIIGANMYLPYMYKLTFKRSTDKGVSWASQDFADTSFAYSDLVVNAFGSTDVIWANRFVRSFDRGVTWSRLVNFTEESKADRPTMVEDTSGRISIVWWNTAGGIYFSGSK